MKKTPATKTRKRASDEMRPEYRFDYSEARPNRFANHDKEKVLVVIIDPDIAQVFTTPKSINDVLRALITAMPKVAKSKVTARQRSSNNR